MKQILTVPNSTGKQCTPAISNPCPIVDCPNDGVWSEWSECVKIDDNTWKHSRSRNVSNKCKTVCKFETETEICPPESCIYDTKPITPKCEYNPIEKKWQTDAGLAIIKEAKYGASPCTTHKETCPPLDCKQNQLFDEVGECMFDTNLKRLVKTYKKSIQPQYSQFLNQAVYNNKPFIQKK
jgi:hypothetical protein